MTIPDSASAHPFDHGEGCQEDSHDFDIEIPINLYHECAGRMMEHQDKMFSFIMGFKGNKILAFEVVLLALKKFHILGCENDVELGRRHGYGKAHINKIKMDFLKMSGLINQMGDRTETDRKTFSEARKAQLA